MPLADHGPTRVVTTQVAVEGSARAAAFGVSRDVPGPHGCGGVGPSGQDNKISTPSGHRTYPAACVCRARRAYRVGRTDNPIAMWPVEEKPLLPTRRTP